MKKNHPQYLCKLYHVHRTLISTILLYEVRKNFYRNWKKFFASCRNFGGVIFLFDKCFLSRHRTKYGTAIFFTNFSADCLSFGFGTIRSRRKNFFRKTFSKFVDRTCLGCNFSTALHLDLQQTLVYVANLLRLHHRHGNFFAFDKSWSFTGKKNFNNNFDCADFFFLADTFRAKRLLLPVLALSFACVANGTLSDKLERKFRFFAINARNFADDNNFCSDNFFADFKLQVAQKICWKNFQRKAKNFSRFSFSLFNFCDNFLHSAKFDSRTLESCNRLRRRNSKIFRRSCRKICKFKNKFRQPSARHNNFCHRRKCKQKLYARLQQKFSIWKYTLAWK